MNQKRKNVVMILVSLFLFIGLVACGSEESDNDQSDSTNGSSDGDEQADSTEEVEIRFAWWGDTGRNEVYNEIVDRFEEEYPHISVSREFGGWGDYWDRLTTQSAGGNAPDVVSMHQFYVSDYARRNALLNLNELVENGVIDLTNFPESAVDSGKIDDDIFMVAKGITMPGWAFNTAQFDELGVAYPDFDWTWDDFQEKVIELSEAMGEGQWGAQDMSGGQLQPNFRYFLRQNGQDLFNDEGTIAFDEETLIEWWTMWDELRQAEAIPDAATGSEYDGVPLEQSMFGTGRTALHQIPANQIYLYEQQFAEGEVQMVRMPRIEGGNNGEYIEGAYLSISQSSAHPEAAALFIDFFINSEKSAELFKVEQGPPASTEMADFVTELIEPAQARAVDFIQVTVPYGEPAPYAPLGVNEVEQAFTDNAEAIAFGQKTVEEAATDFMNVARSVLE